MLSAYAAFKKHRAGRADAGWYDSPVGCCCVTVSRVGPPFVGCKAHLLRYVALPPRPRPLA